MKLVQGCNLKHRLNSFHAAKSTDDWPRQVEFLRLLEAFVSICRAVAYAHSRSVLHRDIKPGNIMLGNYGEALLLDWGLAKALSKDKPSEINHQPETQNWSRNPVSKIATTTGIQVKTVSSSATQAGAIMGSPAYMSPEIALGNSEIADERTDIYLLGATLYEILTGQPPRTGSSRLELIELAQHTPPTSPRRLDHRIPKALEAICLRAMAHQIGERYKSATALAAEIENYLAGEPIAAYREPLAIRCWRWCRRHRKTIQRTLVSLVLFLLMGLGVFTYYHARELEAREVGRQQLLEFRRLADEAQFFAANVDAVSERAPYYDPQHAIPLGNAALALASQWGDNVSRFPLAGERTEVTSELVDLLLVLANLNQQSGVTTGNNTATLALLDRAAALRPASRAYYQIRTRCLEPLGEDGGYQNTNAIESGSITATAQDYFIEGEVLRKTGRLHDACESYRKCLRLNPKHYWAHFQLSRCYLGLQRGPEAIAALDACIALRPESPWAYCTRGLTWGLLGKFEAAYADLDEAIRLNPQFRPARLNRGFVYSLNNDNTNALAEFDSVMQPPEATALIEAAFYRAQIHYQQGDFNAALRDCESFLAQRPYFAPGHSLAAQIHFRTGDDARAIECIDDALACEPHSAANPQDSDKWITRGKALRELALGLDATTQQRVLQIALSELEAARGQGLSVQQELAAIKDLLGLTAESIEAYTERLTAVPSDLETRKKRAWNCITLRRYDQAATDFETVIQQAPEDSETHTGLGYILALRRDVAAAELEATKAVMYGAHHFLVLHNVACIYAELAEVDQAQQTHFEDLAIAMLERAVLLAKQSSSSVDETELIRAEPAFHDSLRNRLEFRKLLGS